MHILLHSSVQVADISMSSNRYAPTVTLCTLGWVNFQKSPYKVYGPHKMVFQAQISNFVEFGSEMAQHNDLKVFGLNWPFFQFSLILMLKSG